MVDTYRDSRVHITFDVHTDGAEPKNDLPFVVGVMGDFSGDPTGKVKPLDDRRFVDIHRDNFDQVMRGMKVGLNFRAKNTIADDGSELGIDLRFDKMSDLEPASIIEQVEPLKKLMAIRNKLCELMSKVDRSPDLEAWLEGVLQNKDNRLDNLARELGIESEPGE